VLADTVIRSLTITVQLNCLTYLSVQIYHVTLKLCTCCRKLQNKCTGKHYLFS